MLSVILSLLLAWIFFSFRNTKMTFAFVLLTTFLLSFTNYQVSNTQYKKNSLNQFQASSYVDFYGTLYKSVSPRKDSDILYLKVNKVLYQKQEKSIRGRLQVTVARRTPFSNPLQLYVGDRIKISAQPTSLRGYQNFHSFPLKRLMKSQRIHKRAFSKSPLLVEKISSGRKFSPLRLIAVVRQNLLHRIEEFFASPNKAGALSPQGAVLEALLLGERGRMDKTVSRSLQDAGLYHLFAISGAHIALISLLLFSFFRIIRIPIRPSYVILMCILVFYAFLVEGRPSILRATMMALIFLLGKLIWRDTNLLNAISISAFVLLWINPFSLFDAGFQMTFAATLSIVLFFPRIIKYLPKLPLRISEIFALSVTAQLGVLPIMARTFNRVTFSSFILNFAALPLVALIMLCGYLFLPLAFFSSDLANLFVQAIHFLINALISLSHLFDSISFISFRVPTPHLLTVFGYYLFFSLLLFPSRKKRLKAAIFAAYVVIFSVLILHPFPSSSKNLKITFIDVGQGESILVEFPGRKKMLIDGGGLHTGSFDIGERVVSPFLWKKGIKTIDCMVLTHAHPDHLNGLISVARNFRIREFWESLSPAENANYTKLRRLLPPETLHRRVFRNDSFSLDGVAVKILHPERRESYVSFVHNDQSVVLKLAYGQTDFLLTGDIGASAEQDILKSGEDIVNDVLKSPHHGSLSSSSEEFLQAVRPSIIVISVGERNRYNFPDKEVLVRYQETGAFLYRTDFHGAVEITSDGRTLSVRTAIDR
ncbi:MAG: DNA internalization-related competence protein ComEC/Rec2 [Candidatus Aminicenantes bacterium]